MTVNSATGDYNPTSLASVVNAEALNFVGCTNLAGRIRCVNSSACRLRSKSRGADYRKSTPVFCVNRSHVRELAQVFCDAGIDARYVHSTTSATEWKSLVDQGRAVSNSCESRFVAFASPFLPRTDLIPETDQRSQLRALASQTSIVSSLSG